MSKVQQKPPGKVQFKEQLHRIFREAQQTGADEIIVRSGDLHRAAGGYPGRSHNMPSCCDAMMEAKRSSDQVLHSPPKGKGATLSIKYKLPR